MRFAGAAVRRKYVEALWLALLASMVIWYFVPNYVWLWDLQIYRTAAVSLRLGHDPYVDGMAVQRVFHAHLSEHLHESPPYTYVYSPITLLLLKRLAHCNFTLVGLAYGVLYLLGVASILRFGLFATDWRERQVFEVLAPISLFFPGLLHQDTLLSGNVAFILYGAVLAATLFGVKRGRWWPFYVAVVVASCFKAPLLSLLAIPLLCARRQVLPVVGCAVLGVGLFAIQPVIWPVSFHHFIEAVDLQFLFNRDFGSSPAGVVADLLFNVAPYRIVSLVTYLLCAVPVAGTLLWLSRRYLEGVLSAKLWLPVMLLGVVLLNPRLMEYDLAPLALPMGLILWRLLARNNSFGRTLFEFALAATAANAFAISAWKPTECVVLLVLFVGGTWDLVRIVREAKGLRRAEVPAGVQGPGLAVAGRA